MRSSVMGAWLNGEHMVEFSMLTYDNGWATRISKALDPSCADDAVRHEHLKEVQELIDNV